MTPTPHHLTLDDVLGAILHPSGARGVPIIDAAQGRVDAARGMRTTAGVIPDPMFSYQVDNVSFPTSGALTGVSRESQAFATVNLESIYQRAPRVRRANADVNAAEASLVATRREAALTAARAFFRVALAQVAADGARDVVSWLRALDTLTRARVREGVGAEADLIRSQVELGRATADLTMARAELVRARADLAPYLVSPLTSGEHILQLDSIHVVIDSTVDSTMDSTVDRAIVPTRDRDTYIAAALVHRPDIAAANARAASAAAEVALQRTRTIPQLSAMLGTRRTDGVTSMLAGVNIPIPLFDRNRGETQRASGERRTANAEQLWTERLARVDVEAAYATMQLWHEQVAALGPDFLARADESRRITRAAYQDGAIPLLQVLDAVRAYSDARITYFRTRFAEQQSLLDLAVAIGSDPTLKLPSSVSK